MIAFPRERAGPLKALAGRCRSGNRLKGPGPPLVITTSGGAVTLFADLGEVALALTLEHPAGTGRLVVPMTLLDVLDGPGGGSVELNPAKSGRVVVRWTDRGRDREATVEAVAADSPPEVPELPADLAAVDPKFLTALHEAGRTAAKGPGRYAVHRIQVQGRAGRVVGTDTHQALVQSGFALPFFEDLLVPAVPVFGSKELRNQNVRIGRTVTHLVVAVGPWTIWLLLDVEGKFPDVLGVVPRSGTVVDLGEADARFLKDVLPTFPRPDGASEVPVTLDVVGRRIVARALDPLGEVRELPLPDSVATGPAVRVALDRDYLQRIVTLGFRTIRLNDSKPVVALDGDRRTYLVAALHPSSAHPPAGEESSDDESSEPLPPPEVTPMKPESNGHVAAPPSVDGTDPLTEAEALRTLLTDAAVRAGRLVAALKLKKKESKALTQVWSSLKSLNLNP